jgi:hypothetical protein
MNFFKLLAAVFLAVLAAGAVLVGVRELLFDRFPARPNPSSAPRASVALSDSSTTPALAFFEGRRAEELREAEREFARRETTPHSAWFVQLASPVQIDEYTLLAPGTPVRLFEHRGEDATIGFDGAMYDLRAWQLEATALSAPADSESSEF